MTDGEHAGRGVVLAFCECLSRRDFDAMAQLVTSDMTWFVPGQPDRIPYAGLFTFSEIRPNLESFLGSLDTFSFTVVDTTAEGDKVAVDAKSAGTFRGVEYANVYIMQYKLREQKVASLKEFLDQSSVAKFTDRLAETSNI